ncbi:MAG: hypothetical protein ACTHXA_00745 [Gulosibacter sp.]|uniref:hypothetical protein n=1 Tax=Gulosibacter sp. TaxID=2817531 RepID=UPI003F8EB584
MAPKPSDGASNGTESYGFGLKRANRIFFISMAAFMTLLCVGILVYGIAADASGMSSRDRFFKILSLVIGPLGAAFYGVLTYRLLRLFLKSGSLPALEITADGFIDRTMHTSPERLVEWSECRSFHFVLYRQHDYLVFRLENEADFRERSNKGAFSLLSGFNSRRIFGSAHPIQLTHVRATQRELTDAIESVAAGRVTFEGAAR